jgi:hypothetical protein
VFFGFVRKKVGRRAFAPQRLVESYGGEVLGELCDDA